MAVALTLSDMQAAIDAASHGDVITVDGGSTSWSSGTLDTKGKAITLQGSGVDVSTINLSGTASILLNTPVDQANGILTFKGFTVDAGSASAPSAGWVQVWLNSAARATVPTFRTTACKFSFAPPSGGRLFTVFGVYGLIDNCKYQHYGSGGQIFSIDGCIHSEPPRALFQNWFDAQYYGDQKSLVIEDTEFEGDDVHTNDGLDAYDGTKFVYRYCTFDRIAMGWHGYDSSSRAPRLWEIYENTFLGAKATLNQMRGGTGVIWNNVLSGDNLQFRCYRDRDIYPDNLPGCPWDGNFDLKYPGGGYPVGWPLLDQIGRGSFTQAYDYYPYANVSGTSDGSTGTITGMSSTSEYAVDTYVYTSAGFPTGPKKIVSKTANSITLSVNSNAAGACTVYPYYAKPILDCSGDGCTIAEAQPEEKAYLWGNNYEVTADYPGEENYIAKGRDYEEQFTGAKIYTPYKPGYTPLTYPHPLRGVELGARLALVLR
jgi:hypothetical protein